jgi:hypothetical protein
MKLKKLKKEYTAACNNYVITFCEKQDMNFEGWVGGDVGGIAMCNDFYFNLHDIVTDINLEQKKGVIIDWYYDNVTYPEKAINYWSYIRGLRVDEIN